MTLRFAFLSCVLGLTARVPAAENAVPVRAVWIDPDAPEVAEIRAAGEKVIDRLASTLLGEVTAAVAAGGPEEAIDVCHVKALPLTGEAAAGEPRVVAVKRTSLKLRNPANAPDAAETLALARVAAAAATGALPKVLVQRLDRSEGPEWRVYRPVGVAPPCLACHGPTDTLAPGVRTKLAALYPADQATGYAAGQWRGLLRVSLQGMPAARP